MLRVVKCTAFCATLLIAMGGVGATEQLDDALALLDEKRYGEAFELLEPLARAGDFQAQDALSAMYLEGLGVAADIGRAMAWFCAMTHHKTGGRETMRAAWFLAEYFRTGGALPGTAYEAAAPEHEDPIRAYFWFSLMARQSDYFAQTHAKSVTLGTLGAKRVGKDLFAEERTRVEALAKRWHPTRAPPPGKACLALPDGLESPG